MKKFILILMLPLMLNAQQWVWDMAIPNSQRIKTSTDLQKNFYTYGIDGQVTKYNSNGKIIWKKEYPGLTVKRLVCSQADDIYIAGLFKDSLITDAEKIKSLGGNDIFIARLKANGTIAFAAAIGSGSNDEISDISVNIDNDVFVTGTTFDTTYFSGEIFPKAHNGDMFIAKYDLFGNFNAAKFAKLNGELSYSNFGSAALEIETDDQGSVIVMAEISGDVKIDTNSIRDQYATYLLKFNSQLELKWKQRIENEYASDAGNLALDSKNNIIYVVHDFGRQNPGATVFKLFYNQPVIAQFRIDFFGDITGIDVLQSDHIVFTGSKQKWDYSGKRPTVYYLLTGELNVNAQLIWLKQDSSLNYRSGFGIAELDENKLLVAGTFLDTLTLKNKLIMPEFNQFLAFLNPHVSPPQGQTNNSKKETEADKLNGEYPWRKNFYLDGEIREKK